MAPLPTCRAEDRDTPEQIKASKSGAGIHSPGHHQLPQGAGQGDAKAQFYIRKSSHLLNPEHTGELQAPHQTVLTTKCADPPYRTHSQPPAGGRIRHVAHFTGTLSSKEGVPLDKRTTHTLSFQKLLVIPLIFLSRSPCWGGGKHGAKEHLFLDSLRRQTEARSPFCLPPE